MFIMVFRDASEAEKSVFEHFFRRISPVLTCLRCSVDSSILDCVPLPQPGGPRMKISFIGWFKGDALF